MIDDDDLFYLAVSDKLHIAQQVNPRSRAKTGTLCSRVLNHATRPTDKQLVIFPICKSCQAILDLIDEGAMGYG